MDENEALVTSRRDRGCTRWGLVLFLVWVLPSVPAPAAWRAGVATTAITPERPMWMAGYAARTKPSDGKIHDLHAKALVLEDAAGSRLAVVTVDLLGIDRTVRDWIAAEVERRYQIAPANLLINASHTHCGPALHDSRYSIYGSAFYGPTAEQAEQCRAYSEALQQKLADLVGTALEQAFPARLAYTHARAGFAMNRRAKAGPGYNISPNPDGPVDHDVPILRIDHADGGLRAVVFGYACHATTLSFNQFCGDYPGFAQEYLERAHPGLASLFVAGCGGDQNPYPRDRDRALELSRQHGRALANAVEAALEAPPRPVSGPLRTAMEEVTLDFAQPPSREALERQAASDNTYERRHAECLLGQMDGVGGIPSTYPYLVQVIQFGDEVTMVALAGEVVVDYALRLKRDLAGPAVWIAGYSNDVFGYIPSVRILTEGGYEGGGAMLYTPLPGPFASSVEERIIDAVHRLVAKTRLAKGK